MHRASNRSVDALCIGSASTVRRFARCSGPERPHAAVHLDQEALWIQYDPPGSTQLQLHRHSAVRRRNGVVFGWAYDLKVPRCQSLIGLRLHTVPTDRAEVQGHSCKDPSRHSPNPGGSVRPRRCPTRARRCRGSCALSSSVPAATPPCSSRERDEAPAPPCCRRRNSFRLDCRRKQSKYLRESCELSRCNGMSCS